MAEEKGMKQSTQIYIILGIIIALVILDKILLMYSLGYAEWQLGQLKATSFKAKTNGEAPEPPVGP